MSNSNSFRQIGAGKNFLSPTDFIVEVDTSAGAVEIVLPKIANILNTNPSIYQYIGIRFVDISNNASVNNITLTGFETDTINSVTNIVLNTNGVGGLLSLIGNNQWAYLQNITSGGSVETIVCEGVGFLSTERINTGNSASGIYSTAFGKRNSASGYYSTISGGYNNSTTGNRTSIGGGQGNSASGYCSTISGGYNNSASGYNSIIGGGSRNTASGNISTVNGGCNNSASGYLAIVGGGNRNSSTGINATISGGFNHTASGYMSTISGGYQNTASGCFSSILSGRRNQATEFSSSVLSGSNNYVYAPASTIANGSGNVINVLGRGYNNFIGSGSANSMQTACNSFIGSGLCNSISASYSAILGGQFNNICNVNSNTFIVGSCITANRTCATFINNLSIVNLPSSSAGLPSKSLWYDPTNCMVMFVP